MVHVGRQIQANGSYQLQGGFNQSLGAVNLAYASLYAQKGSSGGNLNVSANAYLQLHGRMGAWANFGLGSNGAFETRVNMGIFDQTVNMRVFNDGRGTSTYIGSTNVGLTIPIIDKTISAGLVIENVGGMRIRATTAGLVFDLDSAGCFRLGVGIKPLAGSVRLCFSG